jgi:hypothetical protein
LSFETNTGTQRQEFRVKGTLFKVEIFRLSNDPHDQERFRRRQPAEVEGRRLFFPTAENVIARRYFYPGCHRVTPYGALTDRDPRLGQTERLTERVLCLPTGTAVGPDDINAICGILRTAIANGPAVHARLGHTQPSR